MDSVSYTHLSSLNNGIRFYETAIHKFLGNSLIKRLEEVRFSSDEEIRARLIPEMCIRDSR